MDPKVWLISGCRTAIGSFGKSLKDYSAAQLCGHVMKAAVSRVGIPEAAIDGIVFGHGYQNSYEPNTARFAALNAGFPPTIPAMTVQRQCGSGMEAAAVAGNEIRLGKAQLMLSGGVESMTNTPYLLPPNLRFSQFALLWQKYSRIGKFGPRPIIFSMADDGLAPLRLVWDMKSVYMAGTAQCLSDAYGVTRQQADEFALRSQELAQKAIAAGRFDREIEAIETSSGIFARDEHPRKTSLEKLASLKPVLKTRSITAGNSSGINDGACALVLGSTAKVQELGIEPLVEIVDSCAVGVDPEQMGIGPVFAIKKLLERNQLNINDIDLIEINEAFGAQYVACEKLLGLDRSKVNVNGGAIALGHPIGMTGARLILTLAHELKERGLKCGVASLCIGGGMGIAMLLRRP